MDQNKLWKVLKEMRLTDHITCLLRNLYAGPEATVRSLHETKDGSELTEEYVKAVYCHPAYLNHMRVTSCEMPGWMTHKPESTFPGEKSTTSEM